MTSLLGVEPLGERLETVAKVLGTRRRRGRPQSRCQERDTDRLQESKSTLHAHPPFRT